MTSKKLSDSLSLDLEIPLTREDIQALRESRPRAGADWPEQLQSLANQFPVSEEVMRRRPTFEGYEPFEL